MLGMTLHTRRTVARSLLALMGSLWLLAAAAPCAMATTTHCPGMPGTSCETMSFVGSLAPTDTADCDSLQSVDCQREDGSPANRSTAVDFNVAPVLLTTAPLIIQPIPLRPMSGDPDRLVLRLSPPPLYLQHTALLF